MSVIWSDEMIIDNGIIDADHRDLIEIINEFDRQLQGGAARDKLLGSLHQLVVYTEVHFAREERLQELIGFGMRFPHQKVHLAIVKRLLALEQRIAAADPNSATDLPQEIVDFLDDWLTTHILEEDMRMKPYLAEIKKKRMEKASLAELVAKRNATEAKPTKKAG